MKNTEGKLFTLPNGMRIFHREHSPSPVAHCVLMIGAGTRDEDHDENGMAHFIEHLLFKGTHRRKTHHILNRIESVGGDLNAFTTKEYICLHTSTLHEFIRRSLDLLVDMVFNSVFDINHIEREKLVIGEEIDSTFDDPEESINDDFEEMLFHGSSLGSNILGSRQSISAFSRKSILRFIERNFQPGNIIIAVDGNINHNSLRKHIEKLCEPIKKRNSFIKRTLMPYVPDLKRIKRKSIQAHCISGTRAYGIHEKERFALYLLNDILGGAGMSSRLNMNIREKLGLTYAIESYYMPYSDTGNFSIYLATELKNMGRCLKLIEKEIKLLQRKAFSSLQLFKFKKRLIGRISLAEENRIGTLIAASRNIIDFERVVSHEESIENIENVSVSDILNVANEVLNINARSTLIYEPEESK